MITENSFPSSVQVRDEDWDPNYSALELKVKKLLAGITPLQNFKNNSNSKTKKRNTNTVYLENFSSESEDGFRALALLLRTPGRSREAVISRIAELIDPDVSSKREPRRLIFNKRKLGTGTIHDPRKAFAIATDVIWWKYNSQSLDEALRSTAEERGFSFERVRDAYYMAKELFPNLFEDSVSS